MIINGTKLEKKWQKLSKNAKIRDFKILQDIPLQLEIIHQPFLNPRGGSLALKAEEKTKSTKNFKKKLEKKF